MEDVLVVDVPFDDVVEPLTGRAADPLDEVAVIGNRHRAFESADVAPTPRTVRRRQGLVAFLGEHPVGHRAGCPFERLVIGVGIGLGFDVGGQIGNIGIEEQTLGRTSPTTRMEDLAVERFVRRRQAIAERAEPAVEALATAVLPGAARKGMPACPRGAIRVRRRRSALRPSPLRRFAERTCRKGAAIRSRAALATNSGSRRPAGDACIAERGCRSARRPAARAG